jgi:hypothetical protein
MAPLPFTSYVVKYRTIVSISSSLLQSSVIVSSSLRNLVSLISNLRSISWRSCISAEAFELGIVRADQLQDNYSKIWISLRLLDPGAERSDTSWAVERYILKYMGGNSVFRRTTRLVCYVLGTYGCSASRV